MKIYKYGDNVDTDVIIPARYLNSFDAKELAVLKRYWELIRMMKSLLIFQLV